MTQRSDAGDAAVAPRVDATRPELRGQPGLVGKAMEDMRQGVTHWRVWYSLGMNDVKQRYRRSRVGQFWLTISMAVSILAMGIVFSVLFNMNTREYLPFVGISMTTWGLISSLVNEMTGTFIQSDSYLRSYPGPRSIVLYRTVFRNVVLFAHNLVLIPPLMIYGSIPVTFASAAFLFGFAFIVVNSIWVGLLFGMLATRFRDMQQIVQNMIAVIFFLTPVMYRPEQIVHRLPALVYWNPFSVFLELIRAPLLGEIPGFFFYAYAFVFTIIGFAIGIPFFARFRSRIAYWL